MSGERELVLGREDPPFPCPDCGAPATVARGGVKEDGRDLAIYVAARVEGHRPVALAIAWGTWGEGSDSSARVVVSLLARVEEGGVLEMMVVDPERTPFQCDAILGRSLRRREALAHAAIQDIFELGEAVANSDPRVSDWLGATRLQ